MCISMCGKGGAGHATVFAGAFEGAAHTDVKSHSTPIQFSRALLRAFVQRAFVDCCNHDVYMLMLVWQRAAVTLCSHR